MRLGADVRPGLLAQDQGGLDPDRSPVETLRPLAAVEEAELRRILHHYLITAAEAHTPAGRLSYGQRARLALAVLAPQGVNLRLLDEPTNHLDIPSREAFEEALGRFPGTVLVVSHDRYFVEAFADRTLVVAGGTVRDVPLRAWRRPLSAPPRGAIIPAPQARPGGRGSSPRGGRPPPC
ncbi:MAG TPA: ATP-binding cassette domain-containing protein [Dehalococcoidia bacterium]